MPNQESYSETSRSLLVRHFVQRSGVGAKARPEDVITKLVESVRRRRIRSLNNQLQHFLRDRNVTQIYVASDLNCDGLIEPLGRCFRDGFRMRLKKNTAEARIRFTLAHEVCHTFFYELVPEIKFFPHDQDNEEERLCNVGELPFWCLPPRFCERSKGYLLVLRHWNSLHHNTQSAYRRWPSVYKLSVAGNASCRFGIEWSTAALR